jgi:aryl-alcohol dehydrogenase-like predicted oxidoreductase
MDYTILGRTGLKVSVMGIGGGGPSGLGQYSGKSKEESIALVRQGLDAGINFFDTSEVYRTEDIIGEAIKGIDRESLVLSTKKGTLDNLTPDDVRRSLEKSLKNLGTDYIDIYHLHAVRSKNYNYLMSEIAPVLIELKEEGIIRFIGITEYFTGDTKHEMLQKALQDDIWDVIMVGFNILNQSARIHIFPKTIEKNIGVLIMFAIRRALSHPKRLKRILKKLISNNQINSLDIDLSNPLNFLVHSGGAVNLVDAAYRFCRYEPGPHVILSGTGNSEHLKANIESFSRPPLPKEEVEKLKKIFKKVDSVSGT